MHLKGPHNASGFTLVETLVAMVIGSILVLSLFKIWNTNRLQSDRIQNKSDFRDRATLATTALNRSITMAGFGLTKIDVIAKGTSELTDTLTVFSNPSEFRTTLRDTGRVGSNKILVFNNSGFVVGVLIGLTDSLRQEYVRLESVSGDSTKGFLLSFSPALKNRYLPGVPDVYPVQKEKFFINAADSSLVHLKDDNTRKLAEGMTEFRIDLRDASGSPTVLCKKIRVVTFSLMGCYKTQTGTPNQMRFSTTVIPRNLL